jgi:hypothetical protein|tara:strand:+ start:379 stop:594 length:216 start_codon:yes stop_codon:yes gene_type:complete
MDLIQLFHLSLPQVVEVLVEVVPLQVPQAETEDPVEAVAESNKLVVVQETHLQYHPLKEIMVVQVQDLTEL